ncbi:U2 small nuclear ribonucleoprotein A' [Hibiscus syriacus]|uniref:U2 small nuclear ribonucleoprotein A n=1 Tax=Hibiscus syriacus TaxID=106335 RepID=A0A6A2X4K3_HIBSY|nr:heparan-alpha-glucosaminide N-acetyltransferase-like [Hibiscus syriacus]KAE8663740.1 U2 small nuclear ribonucleoprotein A' [Hibiscus syriacus]
METEDCRERQMAIEYEPIKGYANDSEGSVYAQDKYLGIGIDIDNAEKIQDDDEKKLSQLAIQISYPNIVNRGEESPLVPTSTSTNLPLHRQQPPQRLVSLDVFRGLTIALMILVDDVGGLLPAINHSPWNGLTLADYVMPFFLFIVGVSLGLTYKRVSCRVTATRKAILRALKLLILGLFLQGGFFHGIKNLTYGIDIDQMRLMGILQRIAIAYLVAALCEIWLKGDNHATSQLALLRKYQFQWLAASVLAVIYISLLYGLYVPTWQYQIPDSTSSSAPKILSVNCGVRGDTGPACNVIGMIDRKILGIQHLYRKPVFERTKQCSINSPDNGPLPFDAPTWCQAPFEPEGLLSSVMAVVTCLVGLHYGHMIVHFKDHRDRIRLWLIPSSAFLVLGLALDIFGMHINKALYTFSYMCVTAGAAGFLFAGIYLLVDIYGYRRMASVLEWMGKHALIIYILAACNIIPIIIQGFYWKQPQNNILSLIGIGR